MPCSHALLPTGVTTVVACTAPSPRAMPAPAIADAARGRRSRGRGGGRSTADALDSGPEPVVGRRAVRRHRLPLRGGRGATASRPVDQPTPGVGLAQRPSDDRATVPASPGSVSGHDAHPGDLQTRRRRAGLTGEIIGRLERKGLRLVAASLRTIDEDTAGRHYEEHQGKPFYDELVTFITRSPSMVLVVEGPEDTWRIVRTLMGPDQSGRGPAGDHPRRSGDDPEREPDPRIGLGRVGEAGDRNLLSRSDVRSRSSRGTTVGSACETRARWAWCHSGRGPVVTGSDDEGRRTAPCVDRRRPVAFGHSHTPHGGSSTKWSPRADHEVDRSA